ncbi:hypothetical protein C1J00_22470 [Streptomyces cahuitamycinicus]|uniref:Uncharacterized protein n=1 Tax=Streptomyces cahuitamycinicus TaxID=2070367 RepID=A0A2N8TLY7_9ACTN|nr:hypothetical protein C1J00_22470 [Streptomyces cahuitamycinicus]
MVASAYAAWCSDGTETGGGTAEEVVQTWSRRSRMAGSCVLGGATPESRWTVRTAVFDATWCLLGGVVHERSKYTGETDINVCTSPTC